MVDTVFSIYASIADCMPNVYPSIPCDVMWSEMLTYKKWQNESENFTKCLTFGFFCLVFSAVLHIHVACEINLLFSVCVVCFMEEACRTNINSLAKEEVFSLVYYLIVNFACKSKDLGGELFGMVVFYGVQKVLLKKLDEIGNWLVKCTQMRQAFVWFRGWK